MIGGIQGFYNLFPFMVEIFMQINDSIPQHHCSGSLISFEWVLTAAHCVELSPNNVYFLGAGRMTNSHKMLKNGNMKFDFGQTRRIDLILIHEKYDKTSQYDDIALIKVRFPFQDNLDVQPISLPSKDEQKDLSLLYKYCYIGGWGMIGSNIVKYYDHKQKIWKYNEDDKRTNQLAYVVLPLISNKQCRRLWYEDTEIDFYVIEKQMCTLYYPGRKSACRGDSGGPLICGSKQYGISTWSFSCGIPRIGADVYTRVDKYLDWINNTITTAMKNKKTYYHKSIDGSENLPFDYYEAGDFVDIRSSVNNIKAVLIFKLVLNYLLLSLTK